jgi:hypothetical protein
MSALSGLQAYTLPGLSIPPGWAEFALPAPGHCLEAPGAGPEGCRRCVAGCRRLRDRWGFGLALTESRSARAWAQDGSGRTGASAVQAVMIKLNQYQESEWQPIEPGRRSFSLLAHSDHHKSPANTGKLILSSQQGPIVLWSKADLVLAIFGCLCYLSTVTRSVL